MVYVGRHSVRSTSSVARRWAAASLVAAASLMALFWSSAAANGSVAPPVHVPAVATPGGAAANPPPATELGGAPDRDSAMRAPEKGSQPSLAPTARPTIPAAPVAEQSTDRWGFLYSTGTGEWLFLSGFLLLLLSISGLVTVGIYRRRW